ncbi:MULTISPECIES: preprotein translocase [unclassified Rhodococcus (in: high G+C Gram-positive bacteria)]|uniref:preprotein translocase n=1 Tax=Rhodococcus sp. SJ-3 TaxID=3454628 RepID=UPI003F7A74A7
MFGLTFEKLFLVAIIAGVVLGPQRLPVYAHRLARTVRALRDFVESTRGSAEREMGLTTSLDLKQYDPRRIVRDALNEPAIPAVTDEIADQARRVRPGQKYLAAGSAAHPRRILIESLPDDDPRRIAATPARPDAELDRAAD